MTKTPMMTYPQYAKSVDPDVLATIERNKERKKEMVERARAFSQAHGGGGDFYYSEFLGYHVTGIMGAEKPTTGQWKAMPRSDGWVPYVNNPVNAEFEALQFTSDPTPGIPKLLHSAYDSDGRQRVGHPTTFIQDGVAYSGTAITPIDEVGVDIPWEEIKASEFHAAMESYNEALTASPEAELKS